MASCNTNHLSPKLPICSKQTQVTVIIVPFPAQGHLNQLLQLASIISSSYELPVHFVSSTTHNRQAKLRANNGLNNLDIHFHDLHIPPFHSPSPQTNSSNKFPGHLQSCWDACMHLRQPVYEILHSLSSTSRRIIVIHDLLMAVVAQDAISISNAEIYTFNCLSVFNQYCMACDGKGKAFPVELFPKDQFPRVEECITNEFMNFILTQLGVMKFSNGVVFNTCRLMEKDYIELLEKEEANENRRLWAIGPLLTRTPLRLRSDQHNCLKWLDKQSPKSVIYVAFGTSTSMTNEQIKELAIALDESGQKFIWVLRDADRGDIFSAEGEKRIELPNGYDDRIKGNGMVVRDWAPQTEILAHKATGGFMSHCGWNSCIESITHGVAIAAWPMHSDQPWNALLIADILKVGLTVREWARHEELVTSSIIKKVVRKLMASEEGDEIRKRAVELGVAVRQSAEEGGSSCLELDSFVAHITR